MSDPRTNRILAEIGVRRARRESPRDRDLHVRLSRAEAEAIRRKAKAEGVSVSQLIRERMVL